MISFGSIHVEGFGSFISPFDFTFAKGGLNLIKGDNGAGKTTLFSALAWAAYGQTLKANGSVETYSWLRKSTYRGTVVDLKFTDGTIHYRIIRFKEFKGEYETFGKGQDRLILIKDGVEWKKYRDKNELKLQIQNIFGVSFNLFKTSVLFGQKMKRLMEEDGTTKKALFEEAFEASFINAIKDKVSKKVQERDLELRVLNSKLDGYDRESISNSQTITRNKQLLTEAMEAQASAQGKRGLEIFNLKSLIKTTQDQLATYGDWEREEEDPNGELNRLAGELLTATKQVTKFEQMRDSLKKKIEKAKESLEKTTESNICPMCGQPFTKEGHKAHKEDLALEISTAKVAVKETNLALLGHIKTQSSLTKQVDTYKQLAKEYNKLEDTREHCQFLQETIDKHNKSLKALKKEPIADGALMIEKLKKVLDEGKAKKKELKRNIDNLNTQITLIDNANKVDKWVLNTPLSNAGLKAYIFSYKLDALNKRLSYYSKYIGFEAKFSVDMASARKDIVAYISRKGNTVAFGDLSGGQSQLVNVAVAFGAHDVIVGEDKFNILILDEIFENLDEVNVDIISDLIIAKTGKKVVYLITHSKDFTPTGASVLEFTLRGGGTTLA